jgi:hypothetical protein
MGHIFISYSHKDTDYAHGLANNLQSIGFEIWIDERLDYGSQWPLEIQKQLDSCDAFILIMSPRSFASEWVQSELQRAKRKLKPIFPMLLEGDEPWLSIESTQFFDVRGGRIPDEKFYRAVKRAVSTDPGDPTLMQSDMVVKSVSRVSPQSASAPRVSTGLIVGVIGVLVVLFVMCMVAIVAVRLLFPGSTASLFPTVVSTEMPTLDIPLVSQPSSTTEITYTQTSIPPTVTFIPPTSTSIPPTFTPVPPTSTSIPPTATPKRSTSIYIEAENGQLGNGAYADHDATASKSSFVNFGGTGTVKFTLDNMKAGQYTVVIHYTKYANNTTTYPDTGFQNLYVNNNPNPISIYYTKTFGDGGSTTWSDTSVTVALEDGANILLISVIPGVIGGSVDYIYVSIVN